MLSARAGGRYDSLRRRFSVFRSHSHGDHYLPIGHFAPYVVNRTQRARFALDALRTVIPSPETELEFTNEYELLIAVILSAQCTDARVNLVTPAFFEAFPSIERLAAAEPEDVYPFIRSVSYPNNKSKHVVGMARMVREDFDGEIPDTIEGLVKLPGVGRKTAQVVASVAYQIDALPVDTHVFRVANRIGITRDADTPLKVERQIKSVVPKSEWGEAHHLLILHGRYTCTARSPKCERCPVRPACLYYERLQRLPQPLSGLDPSQGRYFCQTTGRYFDEPATRVDRYGMTQLACPVSGSMNVFETKSGRTTKRVPDYRVNG
jgi:endonuclease III